MTTAAVPTRPTGVDADRAWQAILSRDAAWDGAFVYAVATTGIYCRPSCPARRPKRDNVTVFDSPGDAERGGFRACRRCQPTSVHPPAIVQRVVWAREHIDERVAAGMSVTLAELASTVGVSPYYLQRTFKAAIGLTPAGYARARRRDQLRGALRREPTVSRAVAAAGYGSESRVYEYGSALLGMTPAQYRAGGGNVEIHFVVVPATLGHVLVATTDRGVCAAAMGDSAAELEAALASDYPGATLVRAADVPDALERVDPSDELSRPRDLGGCTPSAYAVVAARALAGYVNGLIAELPEFRVHAGGTPFQQRVWRALRDVPRGATLSYAELAVRIGAPGAARAVARACATNPIAVLVPCHRIIRGDGGVSGYRWGVERKKALLRRERGA